MPLTTKQKLIILGTSLTITVIILLILISVAVFLYYRFRGGPYDPLAQDPYIMVEGEFDETIPEVNRVIAFDKENYLSKLTSFTQGKYVLINKGDNNIASLQIPDGYEVHLYDDNNFKKELAVYRKSINLPEEVKYKTSSMVITKL